jgi:hypothetical protein
VIGFVHAMHEARHVCMPRRTSSHASEGCDDGGSAQSIKRRVRVKRVRRVDLFHHYMCGSLL